MPWRAVKSKQSLKLMSLVYYSVYRTSQLETAEIQFTLLKDKLPLLCQCSPDQSTKELVQDVSNLSRSNTSWSLAHVAAHLGLVEVLKHPALKK